MKCKKLVCGCMVFMLIFGMCACGKKEKAKDIDYNKSPNQKLKGIKKNRAVEKELNRQDEGFSLEKDVEKADRVAEVIELPTVKRDTEETGHNKLMDLIKKKRGEKSDK